MRSFILVILVFLMAMGCGGNDASSTESATSEPVQAANDGKGIGEVKHVELNDPLDEVMIATGKSIYELKCAACHKLTDQRVVGPGWAGLTERRKPEWIMNMITNVDIMLSEDPEARKLFEECLTRMPNQNVSQDDSRALLEFMYANDSK